MEHHYQKSSKHCKRFGWLLLWFVKNLKGRVVARPSLSCSTLLFITQHRYNGPVTSRTDYTDLNWWHLPFLYLLFSALSRSVPPGDLWFSPNRGWHKQTGQVCIISCRWSITVRSFLMDVGSYSVVARFVGCRSRMFRNKVALIRLMLGTIELLQATLDP